MYMKVLQHATSIAQRKWGGRQTASHRCQGYATQLQGVGGSWRRVYISLFTLGVFFVMLIAQTIENMEGMKVVGQKTETKIGDYSNDILMTYFVVYF